MKKLALMMFAAMFIASCGKQESEVTTANGNVTINFNSATRAASDAPFERLDVLLLDGNGEKVYETSQTSEHYSFGEVTLSLPLGAYQLVAVGHNKQATLSKNAVTFTGGVGDTFCHNGTIKVAEGSNTYAPTLKRNVAMFRLILNDEVPQNVKKFYFEVSGGYIDFDPTTNQGITKYDQTEVFSVNSANIYEVYTFTGESARGSVDINVYAMDAHGNVVAKKQFGKVGIQRACVTQYSGNFFATDDNSVLPVYMGFAVNSEWENTSKYSF